MNHRVLISCLLLPATVGAQAVTGAISGRVFLPDDRPAAGASIVAVSATFLGERRAVAAADGAYRLNALPPGTYQLRITLLGYEPVTVQGAQVELGRTTAATRVVLGAAVTQLAEVRVTPSALSIDPASTAGGGTFRAADYAALPGERDYRAMMKVLPHANESSRGDPINVLGATGLENAYFIDGVHVTAPRMAETATELPYNFLRAVEVRVGGGDATSGRALGATVNAVTYSGSNTFETSVFGFGTHSSLSGNAKALPVLRDRGSISYDAGIRVSGPVARDRLWFSIGLNPSATRTDREVATFGAFPDRRSTLRYATKLTWRPAGPTMVELSLFGDPGTAHSVSVPIAQPDAGFGVLNPDPYRTEQLFGGDVAVLRVTSVLGSRWLVEASLARQRIRDELDGDTELGKSTPFFTDYVTSEIGGGYFARAVSRQERSALTLRATGELGSHTTTIGLEYEDAGVHRSEQLRFVTRFAPDSFEIDDSFLAPGTNRNRVPTVYVQNAWRARRDVTVNAGIRWSVQGITGTDGATAVHLADEWQPRLGVIWRPGDSPRRRVFATYGRIHQQEPLNLASTLFHPGVTSRSYYSVDPRPGGATPDNVIADTTAALAPSDVSGLEAENADEYTLGYEQLVGTAAKLTLRAIQRTLRSSVQWGFDAGGLAFGTPGEGALAFLPRPRREYSALEASLEGTRGSLAYRASYVLSRNFGNYTGQYDSDAGSAYPGMLWGLAFPYHAVNSTGLLPNDRLHAFKVAASRPLFAPLTVGATLSVMSGSPRSVLTVPPEGEGWCPCIPAFLTPRGSAGRTPALWNLDVRFAYETAVRGAGRLRATLDVLQVGNPQRAIRVDELLYRSNLGGVYSNINPAFETPIAFQRPMLARLGVELSR